MFAAVAKALKAQRTLTYSKVACAKAPAAWRCLSRSSAPHPSSATSPSEIRHSSSIHATANLSSALFVGNQGGAIMRTLGKIAATLGVIGAIAASSTVPAGAWYGYHHHHHYYHHRYYGYHHRYYHHRYYAYYRGYDRERYYHYAG